MNDCYEVVKQYRWEIINIRNVEIIDCNEHQANYFEIMGNGSSIDDINFSRDCEMCEVR